MMKMEFLRLLLSLVVVVRSEVADEDPLVQWLRSLELKLPDVTQTTAGITFDVSELVCKKLQITGINSHVQQVGLSMTFGGIGIECAGHFKYSGLIILGGSGDLSAVVTPGPTSTASLDLTGTALSGGVPWKAAIDNCRAKLDFSVQFSGSITAQIVSLFLGLLKPYLSSSITTKVCDQIQTIAAEKLTQKLLALNHLILPPQNLKLLSVEEASPPASHSITKNVEVVRRLSDSALRDTIIDPMDVEPFLDGPRSVDWTQEKLLDWASWFLSDLLGPGRIDKALRWASKNQSTAHIPGPSSPVLDTVIQQTDTGLKLLVKVFLKEVDIEGIDSLAEFSPLHAAGPNSLAFNATFGTPESPSLSFGVDLVARVDAVDSSGQSIAGVLEEEMRLHLGLSKPGITARVDTLVDEDGLHREHTVAQLLFGAKGCLTSLLLKSPVVTSLQLKFAGLSAPLSFTAQSSHQLEADIAALANNAITLFNNVYDKFLPGAVARIAGSEDGLAMINAALSQNLEPGVCPTARDASIEAHNTFPQYYSDWPPIFDNFLRKAIDNFFDFWIKSNNTSLGKGLEDMPSFKLPMIQAMKLRELAFTGLNQITHLRALLPDDSRPTSLAFEAEVACKSQTEPWSPDIRVNGSLVTDAGTLDGTMLIEAPCGKLSMKADVTIDFWSLADLDLPPSLVCAALSPFKKIALTHLEQTYDGGGLFVLQGASGQPQQPFAELCHLHPKACHSAGQMAKALLNPDGANHVLQVFRDSVLSTCGPEARLLRSTFNSKTDSRGYTYVDPSDVSVWISFAIVVMVLSALFMVALQFARRMGSHEAQSQDTCNHSEQVSGQALALSQWTTRTEWSTTITFATSVLLAVTICLRILACYWLPYASAGAIALELQSQTEVIRKDDVLEYTFFGIAEQFLNGGSRYCWTLWIFMSLVAALLSSAILLLVWLTNAFVPYRKTLLRVALFLARCALSETETTSNTAVALHSNVDLPLHLQVQVRMNLQIGAYLSWTCGVLAILSAMLLLTLTHLSSPAEEEEKDWATGEMSSKVFAIQCASSVILVLGLVLWLFLPYAHVVTVGVAGDMIDPVDLRGMDLGTGDFILQSVLFLTLFVAPCVQILCFALGKFQKISAPVLRVVAGVTSSFCLLDLFLLGYLLTWLEGINGFASSAVREMAEPVCKLTQETIGQDCLGINASVAWPGLIGMVLATLAWMVLVNVQVFKFEFGQPVSSRTTCASTAATATETELSA